MQPRAERRPRRLIGLYVPQWIGTTSRGRMSSVACTARCGSRWPVPSVGPHPAIGSNATSIDDRSAIAVEQIGVAGEVHRPLRRAEHIARRRRRGSGCVARVPTSARPGRSRRSRRRTWRDHRRVVSTTLGNPWRRSKPSGPRRHDQVHVAEQAQRRHVQMIHVDVGDQHDVDVTDGLPCRRRGAAAGGRVAASAQDR